MLNPLRISAVFFSLTSLSACGGGGDTVSIPVIQTAPTQSATTMTFAEIVDDFDTLTAVIDPEPELTNAQFPTTGTASYTGQFSGDLGIAGTSVSEEVAGTVAFDLDFADIESSTGSIANLRSDEIDDIDGQINIGLQLTTGPSSSPVVIGGAFGGTLSVTDPDFAAQTSGSANGLLFGGATGVGADRLFFALTQPSGVPTDYSLSGSIVAD